jgi:hypothetical protein
MQNCGKHGTHLPRKKCFFRCRRPRYKAKASCSALGAIGGHAAPILLGAIGGHAAPILLGAIGGHAAPILPKAKANRERP